MASPNASECASSSIAQKSIDLTDDVELSDANGEGARSSPPSDATTDDENDDELCRELTEAEVHNFQRMLARHGDLPAGHRSVGSALTSSGTRVEVDQSYELTDGQFFRIKNVIRDTQGQLYARGLRMVRHSWVLYKKSVIGLPLHCVLPRTLNDVCIVMKAEHSLEAPNSTDDSALEDLWLDKISHYRDIVFTGYGPPDPARSDRRAMDGTESFSYFNKGFSANGTSEQHVREFGTLCCRWKFIEEVEGQRIVGYTLVGLRQEECDKGRSMPNHLRRRDYGSRHRSDQRIYTYGEACAGGGGITRGAKIAGLELSWLLDNWDVSHETLRLNFPRVKILECDVQDFEKPGFQSFVNLMVDVLHISFPCQGHSRANRGTNPERDATNNATCLCLRSIIKRCRPRLVTMEQTDGILSTNEGAFYRMVVYELTKAGYSVRHKVCNMLDYGVPQKRKRLIIIAACPGENLPSWPKITHGYSEGLLPPITFTQAVSRIPVDATLHDVQEMRARWTNFQRGVPRANPDEPVTTVMCSGMRECHPNGNRMPTVREVMTIQDMPFDHQLYGRKEGDFMRQIGNAVPSTFAKKLFDECTASLRRSDAKAAAWKAEVIEID